MVPNVPVVKTPDVVVMTGRFAVEPIAPAFVMLPCACAVGAALTTDSEEYADVPSPTRSVLVVEFQTISPASGVGLTDSSAAVVPRFCCSVGIMNDYRKDFQSEMSSE